MPSSLPLTSYPAALSIPAKLPIPVPATPTRWMRRTREGSISVSTLPLSSCMSPRGSAAQRLHHRVVKAWAELPDANVGAAVVRPIGAERDHQLARAIDPQTGAGEPEMADR